MKVKFSRCNSNNLIDVPQVDGQLIYTKDTGEAYLDVGNVRKKLTDVEEVANKNSVASPILSKLYYETSTDRLFKAKKVVNEFSQEVIEWIDITGATVDYVDTEILGAKGYTDAEITKAKSYADGVSGTAESNAKSYTDSEIVKAKSYADGVASTSENNAKSYTDAEIVKAKSYADNVGTTAEGNAETYADTNFLKKNNTSEFTPTANYHPATKKYVDDNCIPYQPFPAELDTSHTTPDFISSIRALNLPAGSTYLGGVTLTDMPFNGNAEVEIYVYPANVIYLVLRSANVSPYMWECNSHTYRGWEAVGKAYTDNKLSTYVQNTDYATFSKAGLIKNGGYHATRNDGTVYAEKINYETYQSATDGVFIGKGTLENVINNSIILKGTTDPTTATIGYRVGQLYLNTSNNKVYQLVSIDDTDPNDIIYTWQQLVRNTDLSGFEVSSNKTNDIASNSTSQDKYPSAYAVFNQFQRKPVVIWESNDPAEYLKGIQTDLSASPSWQLTNLDMTPFKRIKIYSCAGQKSGTTASASTTPAMILEMSLDSRNAISAYGGNYVGSIIVQKPNDANRLATLTCAVSSDKTSFVVLRQTNLYGTAETSNNDVNANVFMIEGYYD